MKFIQIAFTNICLLLPILTLAQSGNADLDNYMTEVRSGSSKSIPKAILATSDQAGLFAGLQHYASDSLDNIRSKTYYIIKRVGQNSADDEIRQQAITQLIIAINDINTGISGSASEALTGFKKADFTTIHKADIAKLIQPNTPHLDMVLKLAGYVEISNDPFDLIINSNLSFKYKWAVRLALARMGDQESIAYLLNKVEKAPINDDFVYDIVPDLVYTHQMDIYKYLEGILKSDEQNCMSADPESSQNILCGYRVMEYLAQCIKSYPLQTDEFGDLEVEDYESGLQQVRKWLVMNPNYQILTSAF
jgi:hypothetical protein